MNRRSFLAGVTLSALGTPLLSAGDAKKPTISFGFSLYGMRTLPLDRALATCADIGYDAVELAVMPDWPADPKKLGRDDRQQLKKLLNDHRLLLPALMENLPLDGDEATHKAQMDRLKAAAQLAHDLSPDQPPLIETILGGKVDQWDKLKQQFADRLGDWVKLAEEHKVLLAIKPHRSNAMNTPEHALHLLEKVPHPRLRLAYDYSHFDRRNLTIAETMRAMIPHTVFIHIKDTRVEKEQVQFVLPGEGTIDYETLLKEAKKLGYNGCVCVEVSGMVHNKKDYDPTEAAKKSWRAVSPAFEKAGIERTRK